MEIRQLTSPRQFELLTEELLPLLRRWMERERVGGEPQDLLRHLALDCSAAQHGCWVGIGPGGQVNAVALASYAGTHALLHFVEVDDEESKRNALGEMMTVICDWARELGAAVILHRSVRVHEQSGNPERHVRRRWYPLGFQPVAVELEKVL